MNREQKSRQGMVALSIVIILSGVLVALATTVTYLSIGEAQTGLAHFKGSDNLGLVEGCVEDYLLKIRSNSGFSAQNITRPQGTCTIVINSPNPNWDITVSSSSPLYKRSIRVVFVRNPTGIILTSWKEI